LLDGYFVRRGLWPWTINDEGRRTMSGLTYSAAVVTYRRAASLRDVLLSISGQVPPPRLTVVADNDPERSAECVVEELRDGWPGRIEYVPVGENLGPAGGWAEAVARAQRLPQSRGDYVLVVDDDDLLGSPHLVRALLEVAERSGPTVAGVGLRGARLNRPKALLERVEPPEGSSGPVDYLASNGAPLYRWAAVDKVGFFERDLFFGFEDLDLGMRLARAGWTLKVAPLPSLHVVADTSPNRTAWREYYKNRSLLWILRRHVGVRAVAVALLRSTTLGGARLAIETRNVDLMRARWMGSADGLSGRLGRSRYEPTENPPKSKLSKGVVR
jgi:GT2 family glycosyltransferase